VRSVHPYILTADRPLLERQGGKRADNEIIDFWRLLFDEPFDSEENGIVDLHPGSTVLSLSLFLSLLVLFLSLSRIHTNTHTHTHTPSGQRGPSIYSFAPHLYHMSTTFGDKRMEMG